jgi:hypothetical protein
VITPSITMRPSGARKSAPSPAPIATGTMPGDQRERRHQIGRSRTRPASTARRVVTSSCTSSSASARALTGPRRPHRAPASPARAPDPRCAAARAIPARRSEFATRIVGGGATGTNATEYAVTHDGRFLIHQMSDESPVPITLILNPKPYSLARASLGRIGVATVKKRSDSSCWRPSWSRPRQQGSVMTQDTIQSTRAASRSARTSPQASGVKQSRCGGDYRRSRS